MSTSLPPDEELDLKKIALLKEEGRIDLKLKHNNTLVNFLSVLPEMVTNAV